ncbi:MAG: fumarylacetoacetase [Saprospiraceae bacterium]|nr:fumarylacetoacetase [Saprospiraceae bacterium]
MHRVHKNSDFSIHNIPFGITGINGQQHVSTRVGDFVINLVELQNKGIFDEFSILQSVFTSMYFNDFLHLGKKITVAVRKKIQEYFQQFGLDSIPAYDIRTVMMSLPVQIGDYTDFYSSREHATNVGIMFRDPANALLPNWLHLPVGYHGRSSSITVSGTTVKRPKGQTLPPEAEKPVFGPSKQIDFELEMAFIIGKENQLGEPISIENAEDYIFGLTLFNDWSARDIQKWEYVPLGPFLSKNFASTMSPWIVTLEALEPFRVAGPVQEPEVLPYLQTKSSNNYDINLDVIITTPEEKENTVSHSNFKYMYWSMVQQLAHHTVNGCNMRVGDVLASGTISGPSPDSYGSMLEIAWKGTKPVQMSDGSTRTFIQDGDTVTLKGYAEKDGIRVGFGECTARLLPAD